MRPVTVVPRRIAGGGSLSRTLTRNVPVTGSARGATSRTVPVATTFGSDVSTTVISALAGAASLTRAGTSNTASRPPSRATCDDHAAAADDLAGLGARAVTDAGHVGDEPRVGEPVLRRA